MNVYSGGTRTGRNKTRVHESLTTTRWNCHLALLSVIQQTWSFTIDVLDAIVEK